ncbi:hypothetical protein AAG570_001530 [Ranatra chinensis]|uniref:Letm1 RBD domain-containing protein n=1 Tax=Ranatra chinensis TaxID=642074 RepID=A0ABD0YMU6_9HEMI
MRIYRIFKVGIKDFYLDVKEYAKIIRKINAHERGLEILTRHELEIYHRLPKDMYRVAPVLLVSAIPFANYVAFPLAYYFPRYLLSSHFWSLQQRIQFAVLDQKMKLKHYKPVFRCLQASLGTIKGDKLYPVWRQCIALLGSGLHPSPQHISVCAKLFSERPYGLQSLSSKHLRSLLKMHNMHSGWRKRKRLTEHARIIHLMDLAIDREGGVGKLSHDDVRTACFLRGLNPTNMNAEETVVWLSDWVNLSKEVTEENLSLILHFPILMSYNHPSNWVLIH